MTKIKKQASILIDEYIRKAPPFARPICKKIRSIIHAADSEIAEDWKWGPNFSKSGMVCGFGAFQEHVSLAFFKGALMKDQHGILKFGGANRYSRTVKFVSEQEVNEAVLTEYVREAVIINEKGIKVPPASKEVNIPADLENKLLQNKKAQDNFLKMAYTYRKEFVQWVENARRQATRERRISEVVKRSALNQKLNEKYS